MNPFLKQWPFLDEHDPADEVCAPNLRDRFYVRLSNSPVLPRASDMIGHTVVIAGKARTGKSVISHVLIHELVTDTRNSIDLAINGQRNKLDEGGDESCFERIITWADHQNLFKNSGAPDRIRSKRGREAQNLQLATELGNSALVIRMPALDTWLKPTSIAHDIGLYAASARLLKTSVYLYEYSYPSIGERRALYDALQFEHIRNMEIIETPLLLVGDAMEFIDTQLKSHPLGCDAINWDETKSFLEAQAESNGGLESCLGDLSDAMHRAFEESEKRGFNQVPSWLIAREYQRGRPG